MATNAVVIFLVCQAAGGTHDSNCEDEYEYPNLCFIKTFQ